MNANTNKLENSNDVSEHTQQDKIDSIIEYGESKIKQIFNEIKKGIPNYRDSFFILNIQINIYSLTTQTLILALTEG